MSTITPSAAYLKELITLMHRNGYSQPALVQLLFGIIDEYCGLFSSCQGPGRPATYSLSTILKLDMLMHLTGKRGETKFCAPSTVTIAFIFLNCPVKRADWELRRDIVYRLGVHLKKIRSLDTLPLPVATGTLRTGRCRALCQYAKFWSFKVGVLQIPSKRCIKGI